MIEISALIRAVTLLASLPFEAKRSQQPGGRCYAGTLTSDL